MRRPSAVAARRCARWPSRFRNCCATGASGRWQDGLVSGRERGGLGLWRWVAAHPWAYRLALATAARGLRSISVPARTGRAPAHPTAPGGWRLDGLARPASPGGRDVPGALAAARRGRIVVSAREEILGRVRRATRADTIAGAGRLAAPLLRTTPWEQRVTRFTARAQAASATVARVATVDGVADAVADYLDALAAVARRAPERGATRPCAGGVGRLQCDARAAAARRRHAGQRLFRGGG